MKKSDKEKLLTEAKKFLKNNNLLIKHNIYSMSGGITIDSNVKNENQFDSYLEDFLFDLKINKINGTKYLYDFTRDLIKDPETQDIGLKFILSKAPSVTNYDYSDYIKDTIVILRHYPDSYFDFISQTKFLETNLMDLEKYFKDIKTQEHKEAIVEKCFSLKTFTSLKSQTYLYNLIHKELNNPEKYYDFFPSIKPVSEEEDIFGDVNKEEIITVQINVNKLNSRYIEQCYGKEITNKVSRTVNIINKNTSLNSLGSNKIIYESDEQKENIYLHFIGHNMAESKIKFFINALFKKPFDTNDYNISHVELTLENIQNSLKETSQKYLSTTLSETDKVVKKAKI